MAESCSFRSCSRAARLRRLSAARPPASARPLHGAGGDLPAPCWRRVRPRLYAAPSGEPALGPTAFMHRPRPCTTIPPSATTGRTRRTSPWCLDCRRLHRLGEARRLIFHGREPTRTGGPRPRCARLVVGPLSVNPPSARASRSPTATSTARGLATDVSLHRVTASGSFSTPISRRKLRGDRHLGGRRVGSRVRQRARGGNPGPRRQQCPVRAAGVRAEARHDLVVPGDPRQSTASSRVSSDTSTASPELRRSLHRRHGRHRVVPAGSKRSMGHGRPSRVLLRGLQPAKSDQPRAHERHVKHAARAARPGKDRSAA